MHGQNHIKLVEVNLRRYNQRCLYQKLKRFGDDEREMWPCCCSAYRLYLTKRANRTLRRTVVEPSHTEVSVLYKVLGNLRAISFFMKFVGDHLLNVFMSLTY